jgi:2-phospho-L-lactate/phosphoenolpyruvate guanylyltransferase
MWAVLPVKSLKKVKTRLSPALSPVERVDLFRCMLHDVLSTLVEVREIERALIVTCDPEVVRIASRFDVSILNDESDDGHTAAVGRAAQWLISRGADGLLQVPADIPGVTPQELADVLAIHYAKRSRAFTISPSHDYGGSNCVVCTPPDVIDLSFGNDSFRRHMSIAHAAEVECSIVERPGIALDIDCPQDLANFLRLNSSTHTHRFLSASGIGRRVSEFVRTGSEKEEVV